MAYKTPGIYIKEISLFPPSVAEVETAIPAFIGYTKKAERKGESLTNVPTKIGSLLEFQELFGGEHEITSISVTVDTANNYAVDSVTIATRYYMFEALRLFFDNGGGDCYIVSVGKYGDTVQNGDESAANNPGLRVGLKALEKYDEPTIILFPDAPLLATEAHLYTLQQLALAQCTRLQDRVSVFDLKEGGRSLDSSVTAFRNGIGINNLKYGAAYTPWLYSAYPKDVDFNVFRSNVTDTGAAAVDLATITSDADQNALVTSAVTTIGDQGTLNTSITTLRSTSPTLKDRYAGLRNTLNASDNASAAADFSALLAFVRSVALEIPAWNTSLNGANLGRDLDTYALDKLASAVEALIGLEKNADVAVLTGRSVGDVNTDFQGTGSEVYDATGWLAALDTDADTQAVDDILATATDYGDPAAAALATALAAADDVDGIFESLDSFIADVVAAAGVHAEMAQTTLYDGHPIVSNIVEHIKKDLAKVPPSGAVVGLYAYVDNARGVWKAPANVSVASVLGPVEPIDDSDQENLNVDTNAGKSINAIRAFAGRGTIIWGARTLAGNDNEWRYVPVRRFFNMVEESVKKSTAWAVFEPNSAPLWTKVKAMIDNYLTQKWREGALAGATPDEAFFVKVGLGQTMTAQDILEGRLIVEIGMAVVRPAEFIILKFSHKMQES